MKREMISEAVGNIHDKYVEEADMLQESVKAQEADAAQKAGKLQEAEKLQEATGAQDAGMSQETDVPQETRKVQEATGAQDVGMSQEVELSREKLVRLRRKWTRHKRILLTACICLLIVGVGGLAVFRIAHPWNFKVVTLEGKRGETQNLMSTVVLPRWEERPIYSQYSNIKWNGVEYDSSRTEIPADRVGEFLGETIAYGEDHYAKAEEARRERKAKVYAITKLSTEWLVAVQYEGAEGFYAFEKRWFIPETMGEFLEKMNLYEEAVFGTVSYSYTNVFGQYVSVRFDDVSQEMIHKWLLSTPEAVNEEDQQLIHLRPREILGISVDVPIEGRENIALQVCENGYIWTNIVDTGALFYVGEENTESFIDYVLNECNGYETIYIYEEEGVIGSLFGDDFGGQSTSTFWDSLFDGSGEGEGASDPSVAPGTQSSQGYNPTGGVSSGSEQEGGWAASPSVSAAPSENSVADPSKS